MFRGNSATILEFLPKHLFHRNDMLSIPVQGPEFSALVCIGSICNTNLSTRSIVLVKTAKASNPLHLNNTNFRQSQKDNDRILSSVFVWEYARLNLKD